MAKILWFADNPAEKRIFYLKGLTAIAYLLPRLEDAVEPIHIHHEPCCALWRQTKCLRTQLKVPQLQQRVCFFGAKTRPRSFI